MQFDAHDNRIPRHLNQCIEWYDIGVSLRLIVWTQYKTVKIQTTGLRGGEIDTEELDDLLNSFSSQGWEFANAFDTATANGASKYVVVILRRSI